MPIEHALISADSHILEPPDVWSDYMDPAFRDRAPRIEAFRDADRWCVDGVPYGDIGHVIQAGQRYKDAGKIKLAGRWANVPEAAYEPHAYLGAMDLEGVAGAVIFPTEGLYLYRVANVPLLGAICRAYNRWIAEVCATEPRRLKGVAMINVDDVDAAVREIEASARSGLAIGMIPVFPSAGQSYLSRALDPLWAAAADIGMVICLHAGTNRPGAKELDNDLASVTPATRTTLDYWVRHSLAEIIFAGVFERHPNLKVVSTENEVGWVPHFLNQMDFVYAERRYMTPVRFRDGRRPRDVWHSNVAITFLEDPIGIRLRDLVGVGNLMWGSDYPHSESTWPRSREVLDRVLADVPDTERRAMLHDNAAALFGFD